MDNAVGWTRLLLAMIAAGCGDDGAAAAMDASSDTPEVEGCVAQIRSGTLEGVAVVFHDAGGLPLATVTTDATGVAHFAECVDGGMVTFVDPGTEGRNIYVTARGVHRGATVTWGVPVPATIPAMDVQLACPDEAGTLAAPTSYRGRVGDCTVPITLPDSTCGFMRINDATACVGDDPGDFDILAVARNAQTDAVGFSRATSTTFTGSPIEVTGGAWVPHAGPSAVGLSVPSGLTGTVLVQNQIEGVNYNMGIELASFGPSTTSVNVDAYPPTVVDDYLFNFTSYWTAASAEVVRARYDALPASIDLGSLALGRIDQRMFDTTDGAHVRISWTGGTDDVDFSGVGFIWQDASSEGMWILIGPEGADGSLVAPTMPATAPVPAPGATFALSVSLYQSRLSWASYADILEQGLTADLVSGLRIPVPPQGVWSVAVYDETL